MSLEVTRYIDREYPHLLQTNINATCDQFSDLTVAELRRRGHVAYRMAKTRGEGQYTPPNFVERDVVGLDGKTYRCTGRSHDAIWCDGEQFDLIGQGNDSPDPIFNDDGSRMRGIPTWNAIPRQYWRPNNPPLKELATPTPQPPPPPVPRNMPGREEMMNTGRWLETFYKSPEGLSRSLFKPDEQLVDWEGVGAWLFDVYFNARVVGRSEGEARSAVIAEIQKTSEWKGKHP